MIKKLSLQLTIAISFANTPWVAMATNDSASLIVLMLSLLTHKGVSAPIAFYPPAARASRRSAQWAAGSSGEVPGPVRRVMHRRRTLLPERPTPAGIPAVGVPPGPTAKAAPPERG